MLWILSNTIDDLNNLKCTDHCLDKLGNRISMTKNDIFSVSHLSNVIYLFFFAYIILLSLVRYHTYTTISITLFELKSPVFCFIFSFEDIFLSILCTLLIILIHVYVLVFMCVFAQIQRKRYIERGMFDYHAANIPK